MTTGKDTDCQLHGLDLTTREWDHCGILSLSAASSLKPGTFKHKGVVATVENIYALLTLVTDNLQLQGVMAFTIWISGRACHLDVRGKIDCY